MNKNFISPLGLNPMGVGPKIIKITLPFLLAGIILGYFYPNVSYFPLYNEQILKPAGWIFISFGVFAYVVAIKQFAKGFPKGELITKGVYSLSRNPIYSSWIMFILPGLSMASNNWLFLSGAVAMYISLLVTIKSEEQDLKRIFGESYYHYQSEVNRVFFFPKLKR